MLWRKAWLETRWRFVAGFSILIVLTAGDVYEYVVTQRMMPVAEPALARADRSPLGAAIREAVEVQKEFRGFIWYNAFRDNLTTMGVLFGVLLGCGGLLSESKKGSALFTLSLPVTRRQLIETRTVTGLAQCLAITMVPPLLIPLLAPAVGQRFNPVDALAHGFCLFVVAAMFFAIASFLSTIFEGTWKPLVIALGVACAASILQFTVPQAGVFSVMNGESYFRTGTLPWAGLLTSAVLTAALLYGAADTLERRDF